MKGRKAMQLKVFVLPVKNLGAAEAEKEGVPVYTIFTNEQLAQMVQKKVNSKVGLKEIEGVGDARVEKYGEALMQMLSVPAKP